ncbi:uncharacterized protein LOC143908870 isoform X3 [Temnothorax americanus]|uniref:uncharacterized protein LOC143908870 isoform X3 n=1 Tax=Temnothorax americanus TaxID=1964332 RepID=UPI0040687271
MCFGSLNNECIVFYEMTELHKRSIGERRLRRYAKAEAEKLSRQINDDNNSEYVYMRHDLLANIESDSNSSDEDEEDNNEDEQVNFRQWLREWNLKHNITVEACRELLAKLKLYHPELPLDPRTLNKTPRATSHLKQSKRMQIMTRFQSHAKMILIFMMIKKKICPTGHMSRIWIRIGVHLIRVQKLTKTEVWRT